MVRISCPMDGPGEAQPARPTDHDLTHHGSERIRAVGGRGRPNHRRCFARCNERGIERTLLAGQYLTDGALVDVGFVTARGFMAKVSFSRNLTRVGVCSGLLVRGCEIFAKPRSRTYGRTVSSVVDAATTHMRVWNLNKELSCNPAIAVLFPIKLFSRSRGTGDTESYSLNTSIQIVTLPCPTLPPRPLPIHNRMIPPIRHGHILPASLCLLVTVRSSARHCYNPHAAHGPGSSRHCTSLPPPHG